MALSVIGAGFGRTGTDSMRAALDILGVGPCHHMRVLFENPDKMEQWRTVAHGAEAKWDELYDGYGAAIDWPTCYYWRELAEYYPEAKILLTVRSAESWYASMSKTIIPYMKDRPPDTVGNKIITDLTFGGRMDDADHMMAVFEKNIADVQAAIPADRLLTFNLGDGWEPLCAFLGVPVPDEPFPRTNAAGEEFESMIETLIR